MDGRELPTGPSNTFTDKTKRMPFFCKGGGFRGSEKMQKQLLKHHN